MAAANHQAFRDKVEKKLAPHMETIRERAREALTQVSGKTDEVLANEEKSRKVFSIVHGHLPWPMRLAVKEDAFVEFCLRHRHRLLSASGESRASDERDAANEGASAELDDYVADNDRPPDKGSS